MLGRLLPAGACSLGSLLISQFWSLANDIYDARQAKRVFGFIGGGASLGGIIGAGIAGQFARAIGTNNLLLAAAVLLALCGVIVSTIAMREKPSGPDVAVQEKGMSPREAVALLIKSQAFADHRAGHQLRRDRRGHHRAAGQHGRARKGFLARTTGPRFSPTVSF